MENVCAIGIDVGGTKIAGAIVRFPSGELTHKRTLPTAPERGGEPVLGDVLALAHQLASAAHAAHMRAVGLGLGICELVDLSGNVTSDFTVKWRGIPVQQALSEASPAVVESDVRAHARAEAGFGAGRPYHDFVFVSVGTGISSCLVIDGVPYPGARGNALVLSTSPLTLVFDDGRRTSQVMEQFSSGPALAARFGATQAEEVFEAAEAGSVRARQVLETAGAALGNSVAFLANVLDPEAIIVGGGLGSIDGPYWEQLVAVTREHIWSPGTRSLPIVHAALGNEAGIIGAAAAAWTRYALTPTSALAPST
jgi:glucokinase